MGFGSKCEPCYSRTECNRCNLRFKRMKFILKIGLTAGVAALGLSGCSTAPREAESGPPRAQVSSEALASNAALSGEITSALSHEPKLSGSSISVGVSNLDGSVTLMGAVPQASQEKLAVSIAKRLAQKKKKDAVVVSRVEIQGASKGAGNCGVDPNCPQKAKGSKQAQKNKVINRKSAP
jgi:hypothetical protein